RGTLSSRSRDRSWRCGCLSHDRTLKIVCPTVCRYRGREMKSSSVHESRNGNRVGRTGSNVSALRGLAGAFAAGLLFATSVPADELESGFAHPPPEARVRAYWWWLNGNVTKAAITRDLEQMKAKGWGGALICDAGGADQDGNAPVPHGPTFFTPEWRELYKHTLREANRLGLEMSLNIHSGWNLGGPIVTADDAAKKLAWSELVIAGPTNFSAALPLPNVRDHYHREIAVLAYRLRDDLPDHRAPLRHWREKAMHDALSFSAP